MWTNGVGFIMLWKDTNVKKHEKQVGVLYGKNVDVDNISLSYLCACVRVRNINCEYECEL